MPSQNVDLIRTLFQSRLATLDHLLKLAQAHFGDDESFLQKRIAADMFPFGTQIAFTCNQPRNFALWCDDKPANNLDPDVTSKAQAYGHIANTKELLLGINTEDAKLSEMTRIYEGQSLYIELSGHAYVNEFLIPNFYFHMVTAYDILRMAGVPIGKRDYMMHLVPLIRKE
ncbi:DUF1993 domain-containing protein [Chroococcus sp. FPU101]|uniref:DUF1993 domain-containing protein n=1 Tax=Chroococcus sp. FPU101 TaxID=1974212 RepID=UPI001A8F9ACB|nr:DUF1993 domain-containing protein [Chroococcus sp. FPU101]GFE71987.1 hypothetical protein CFPU101_45970 [Chroococcus sp. FPU101]